jgi:cell filamentation protein
MMDTTDHTSSPEENLLGLTGPEEINYHEARGISHAELFILNLDENAEISVKLILDIHKTAFGELYTWAGKWRAINVKVGGHVPPDPAALPNLMYQFADQVKFNMGQIQSKEDLVNAMAYAHHQMVFIHPFNNGNGRTARLFMNFIAMASGYKPVQLYHREGEDRKTYINAIREGDKGNREVLKQLIFSELMPF